MTEEPLCVVCRKRPAIVRKVCSTCLAFHDSMTGERLSLKQRRLLIEEERQVNLPRDLFRMERPR